jgi:homoserine kinase type II
MSTQDAYLLREYNIGKIRKIMGIQDGFDNSNFLVLTDHLPYILTLCGARLYKNEWEFFLKLQQYLFSKKFPCPEPVANYNNELVTVIKGKPASIYSFLQGKKIEKPNLNQCREFGKFLALLHVQARDFSVFRANDISLLYWAEMFDLINPQIDFIYLGLQDEIKTVLYKVVQHWPTNLPRGIIHGDPLPNNCFFLGDKLSGIFDFYCACNDFYIYDLAIAVNSWCFDENNEFNASKASALLSAYNAVRPLIKEEIEAFPLIALGASLKILLSKTMHWLKPAKEVLVYLKSPHEYVNKMRFHQTINNFASYGITVE